MQSCIATAQIASRQTPIAPNINCTQLAGSKFAVATNARDFAAHSRSALIRHIHMLDAHVDNLSNYELIAFYYWVQWLSIERREITTRYCMYF